MKHGKLDPKGVRAPSSESLRSMKRRARDTDDSSDSSVELRKAYGWGKKPRVQR